MPTWGFLSTTCIELTAVVSMPHGLIPIVFPQAKVLGNDIVTHNHRRQNSGISIDVLPPVRGKT
jgi:hypothetical protein